MKTASREAVASGRDAQVAKNSAMVAAVLAGVAALIAVAALVVVLVKEAAGLSPVPTSRGKTMERTTAAKVINAVSLVAMLAVMWQAVRFVMGDIGNPVAPVFEFVVHTMREGAGLPSEAPASVLSGGPFRGLLEGFQSLMTGRLALPSGWSPP